MATEGGQRAEDSPDSNNSPDSDNSMDGNCLNLSAEESADSDDSMGGKRPNISAEERALLDKLLEMSNNFIRLYEELQPQLQQNINELFTHSKKILDEHSKIKKQHRTSRRSAVWAGVSAGLGAVALSVLLFLLIDETSKSVTFSTINAGTEAPLVGVALAQMSIRSQSILNEFYDLSQYYKFLTTAVVGVALAAVIFGVTSYIHIRKNQNKLTELFEKMKDTTKELLTTAEQGASYQKDICDLAEMILQCYSKFSWRKRQNEDLKTHIDALAELAQLNKPDDLWRFVKEKRSFIWKEKLDELVPPVPLIIPAIRTTEVSKKEKKRGAGQDRVRESQEGRPENMREAAKHLRKIVKEVKTSQLEVEKELLHKLRELIKK